MANVITPIYLIQPSFTTGEISSAVSSRIDLDKYKSALRQAQNAVIRPYGSVYRRQGSKYIGDTKYHDKKSILVKFNYNEVSAYLLEIGDLYIRIWKDGVYTGTELASVFTESDLPNLRFTQSADTLFICSGSHPVYVLQKFANGWVLDKYKFSEVPFDTINITDTKMKVTSSGQNATVTASADIFNTNTIGKVIKILHSMPEVHTSSANTPVKAVDTKTTITDTTNYGIATDVDVYSTDSDISWKFTTHGTWSGTIKLQKSSDGGTTWNDYRSYTSVSDYNPSETGTIKRHEQLKVTLAVTSGSPTLDLNIKPYEVYGLILVTGFTSAAVVTGLVLSNVGLQDTFTTEWFMSAWNKDNGYPKSCAFFQDRLIFGATPKLSYMVWMSRTSDYASFGVEKVEGTVTDDSAITLSLINREELQIQHLVTGQDLIILTTGNEWVISGKETVTPAKATPVCQTQRGSTDCPIQYIGNRIIHVQRRGNTVRDMGYDYASDSYTGIDLTLLAKHLTKGVDLVTATYTQEPDSIIHYVRDDGKMICLTYIREQEVYGWSQWATNGDFEYAVSIPNGQNDVLYTVVKRGNKRHIESFEPVASSDVITDYKMMDCYSVHNVTNKTISIPRLAGYTVQILVDGKRMPDALVPNDGLITTDANGTAIVGLMYETKLEQPNAEIELRDGTIQGRTTKINTVTLRIDKSKGGSVGYTFDNMDRIPDKLDGLYSGDVQITMPNVDMGFNVNGRVCIRSNEPYPFELLAIIRGVTIGGDASIL